MKNIKFYISAILIFTAVFLTANDHMNNSIYTPIFFHETDDELQNNEGSSLETSLLEFTAKGGTIIRLEGDAEPYQLLPGDMVFPACSGGNNRSQTLWNLLRSYSNKISLKQPHATQYGFDPYNRKANWLRIKPPQQNDEFFLWAGVAKSEKLGWDIFADWLTRSEAAPEELNIMLNFYNQEYYNPNLPEGTRRIYITFAKNAHIHLYRLNQTNTSLENVVVLFFPLEDLIKHPLPVWDTYPGSIKSYIEFAGILSPYLDFTKLH
jgi:hypothetical protein